MRTRPFALAVLLAVVPGVLPARAADDTPPLQGGASAVDVKVSRTHIDFRIGKALGSRRNPANNC